LPEAGNATGRGLLYRQLSFRIDGMNILAIKEN